MCRWVSTKPGMTIDFDASITSALGALMFAPHRGNLAALDQHVGLLEIADRAVEAEHAAALDQDRTAGRGRGRLLGLGRADDGDGRGGNGSRRTGAEKLPARQRGRWIAAQLQ